MIFTLVFELLVFIIDNLISIVKCKSRKTCSRGSRFFMLIKSLHVNQTNKIIITQIKILSRKKEPAYSQAQDILLIIDEMSGNHVFHKFSPRHKSNASRNRRNESNSVFVYECIHVYVSTEFIIRISVDAHINNSCRR